MRVCALWRRPRRLRCGYGAGGAATTRRPYGGHTGIVNPKRRSAVMQMQLSTWQEVEGYLANSTGVIVPIGST